MTTWEKHDYLMKSFDLPSSYKNLFHKDVQRFVKKNKILSNLFENLNTTGGIGFSFKSSNKYILFVNLLYEEIKLLDKELEKLHK
jgi:hypothetical protein